jgi:catechol 2,3-dioxygenase-like lactoylglutathione lyase family enzyme
MIAPARVVLQSSPAEPDVVPRSHSDGPSPITLRVQDIGASQHFYAELLGFVPAAGSGYCDGEAILVSPLLANGFRSIVLTRSARPGEASGLRLELETTSELLDRYILARLLGAATKPLATRGRTLMTSILDPDGHRIDLRANYLDNSPRTDDGCRSRPGASRWARHNDDPCRDMSSPRDETGELDPSFPGAQD